MCLGVRHVAGWKNIQQRLALSVIPAAGRAVAAPAAVPIRGFGIFPPPQRGRESCRGAFVTWRAPRLRLNFVFQQ